MKNTFSALPVLGVGASLSLSARPDPLNLAQTPGGPAFIEYAGAVDVAVVQAEVQRLRDAGIPLLFHPAYINFCGTHANHQNWLAATAKHVVAVESPWFAQDCAYCFWQDKPGYSAQLGYFLPPLFNQTSLDYAIARVREVQAAVPAPVAIEPPPLTFIAGTMPLFEFFGELSRQTDCALLLDMGHLVSYEMASGQTVDIAQLPCDNVIEIHIAGGKLKQAEDGPVYVDAHEDQILDETWAMLEKLLPHLPNVKAVCYECEGVAEERVMPTLQRLREVVKQHSSSEGLANV
jgi:uncharacterized protein (UPF0276 family)